MVHSESEEAASARSTQAPRSRVPLPGGRRPTRAAQPRSEDEFNDWLGDVTERADPFMAWLGVVFALLVGYQLAVDLGPRASRILDVLGWSIWSIFLTEFLVKLWLAPSKGRFVRGQWLQLVMLAVPALRLLRFLRLIRLGRALPAARVVSSSYRTVGTAKRLVRSRLGYLAGLTVIAGVALGELAFVFEADHPASVFESFGDALLWSFSTVLALQADPVPTTAGARIAMLVGFAFGLVIVATLAGTVGAFFIEERRERAEAEDHQ